LLRVGVMKLSHSFKSSHIESIVSAVSLQKINSSGDVQNLASFLDNSSNLVVISGAGISTNSGIPDYRGPNGSYRRGHKPITHQEFVSDTDYRKRYWARSIMGWEVFSKATPNEAHYALTQLEKSNKVNQIVTQNVDRLHQRAGSVNVIDLHGRNDIVICLECKHKLPRNTVQNNLILQNHKFYQSLQERIAAYRSNDHECQNNHSIIGETAETKTKRNLNLLMRADGDMELGMTDFSQV